MGGNFRRLLTLVDRGLPIPLGAVHNRRTMVSVWNLIDLIAYILNTASSPMQMVLAADATSLSTPDLVWLLGRGLGKPARLLWVPVVLLRLLGLSHWSP